MLSVVCVYAECVDKVVTWNTASERHFIYPEAEILGQPLTKIMPTRYREDHLRGLERVKATGGSIQTGGTIEVYGLRKDGSEFPIELSLSTWRSNGQMLSCSIIRDITLRKEAEAQLQLHQIE